jgi:hypothetical protein
MGKLEEKLQKKNFERDWIEYIFGFEDKTLDEEWGISDIALEAWQYGCDVSRPLSRGDKIKIKRYRREDCKR